MLSPVNLIYSTCRTLCSRNRAAFPETYQYISCFSLLLYLYPARLQHESYGCSHSVHTLPELEEPP